jgi:hypothetical protein
MPSNPKYAGAHPKIRKEWLAALPPGAPCTRCGHPLRHDLGDTVHLDHDEGGGYLGFSHGTPCRTCGSRCNQAAGGIKAGRLARLRSTKRKGVSRGRRW